MTKREPDRGISIRSVKKNPPDMRKLGRALIALAMAQAEAEAQAQADAQGANSSEPPVEEAS